MAVNVDNRRRLNDHRRRFFEETDGQIAFLCECEDEDCTSSVLLSPRLFDDLREKSRALLHPGHRPGD